MRPTMYPWHEWFKRFLAAGEAKDGKGYQLLKGRDFTCGSSAMSQMIRNEAWENFNCRVSIVEDAEGLRVSARPKEEVAHA